MPIKVSPIKTKKVSYFQKPDDLSLSAWQWQLRKQFGEDNDFHITNLGGHSFFTDFNVFNPRTFNTYKVAIRSLTKDKNFCDCLDFKTNRLGICKHISAVLKKLSKDGNYVKYTQIEYVPFYSSIYLDYRNGREIKIRIGSEKTSDFLRFAQKYFDHTNQLNPSAYPIFEILLQEAKKISEDFVCYDDAISFVIDQRASIQRKLFFEEKFKNDPSLTELESIINTPLFPYQKTGVKFGAIAGRVLLADDMGLGKTLQALAIAELYKKHLKISKVLIVCPTSLKYQWKSEIEKFTKSDVFVIEGQFNKRKDQYLTEDAYYFITSYHTLTNDVDFLKDNLDIDMVILDEAQRIKNWKTKVSKGVKKLESQYAAVLTGTPVENKLEELYSIMQFVDVFKLGPMYEFLDKYQIKDEQNSKIIGYKNLNEISTVLGDVIIRRTKKQVLKELPERMDKNLFVPMTDQQQEIHDDLQNTVSRMVNKWRKQKFLIEQDRQRLMLSMSKMRMVCNSTYILDQNTRHDTKIDELMSILDEYLEDTDNKVVVFSQWERMTRLVASELENRNLKFEYLHGRIESKKRKSLLDNFKNDPNSRVFLSTDAGGVGLNLQSASMVINLDIPWNPAVLEQRIGRVYRLEQNQRVTVINLISSNTIEHRMLDLLKFKSGLSAGILDDGEDSIFLNPDKFKDFMESMEKLNNVPSEKSSTVSDTEEMVENKEPKPRKSKMLIGDDDVEESNLETEPIIENVTSENLLISQGLLFLSSLLETLQSPEATQNFVNSIVAKEADGKTFLKIQIENEKIVQDGVLAIKGILSNFIKK